MTPTNELNALRSDYIEMLLYILQLHAERRPAERITISSTPPGRDDFELFVMKGSDTIAVLTLKLRGVTCVAGSVTGLFEYGKFNELKAFINALFA